MTSLTPVSKDQLRAVLSAEGAAPRRRHGQNFLLDDNMLAAIVRDAELSPGDRVLEIGPGPGLLTRHLLDQGLEVVALEIDDGMRRVASKLLGESPDRLEWVQADALGGGRRLGGALLERLPGVRAVVSNLPYNVAGPILGALLAHDELPERMVVLIQKEMAERLRASPGSKQWGSLGVLAALNAPARRLRAVPRQSFWPAPKVESVVIRLDRKSDRPDPEARRDLAAFLPLAFHNRRKTLLNSVAEAVRRPADEVLQALGVGSFQHKIRAEGLGEVQLCALAQLWAVSALGERRRP